MKKILNLTFIFLLIIFIKLVLSFSINEIVIRNYNNNIYSNVLIKSLYVFNFYQPYIAYYNNGNILYKKEDYNEAINKYNKAISKNPPQEKVCDIRINLSLAMIKKISSNDYKTVYNELEEAKNNLYNDNCASSISDNGYSQDAEKLEEEIKKLQNQLKTNPNNNDSNDLEENNEQEDNEDYSNIEEELKKYEREANASRQSDLTSYENLGDYSYYSGKRW